MRHVSGFTHSLPTDPPDDVLNCTEVDDELARMAEDRDILTAWLEQGDTPDIPADVLATIACCRGDRMIEAIEKLGELLGDLFSADPDNREKAGQRLRDRDEQDQAGDE